MNARTVISAAVAAAMMSLTVSMFAAETTPAAPAQKSEPIYGYRMMTDPERDEYREKMRNARTAEDRQSIRDEHHQQMQARAKERGVTLPDAPRGPRPGAGSGRGPGMGPGAGMGPGDGRGSGMGPGGSGKGPGYGPGSGMGPGGGKGPGYGPGPRGDCPAGQDCPGPGTGKGPGSGPGPRQ